MTDAPVTQPLQEGASPPATAKDLFPADIIANGHDLSVEEHYRIARIPIGQIAERYVVRDAEAFVARVKAAILFWDGVAL